MKNIIPLIIMCILAAGCVARYDERLVGTWKSDRERTLAEFKDIFPKRFENQPEKQEKFAETFGHKTYTYTPTKIKTETGEVRYSVIESGDNYVKIKVDNAEWGCMEYQLTFKDNFQYYSMEENFGVIEYFKKIQ